MRLFVSCPSVYNVYLSLFPHSRMLTITNSARFSRLSPAKMDSNERNHGGFSRRVTNLMTTICTAIYLGTGRRMRRRDPPERKENGFGAINSRGSRLANFVGRSKVCQWKNSKPLSETRTIRVPLDRRKNQQRSFFFLLNEIEIDFLFFVLKSKTAVIKDFQKLRVS